MYFAKKKSLQYKSLIFISVWIMVMSDQMPFSRGVPMGDVKIIADDGLFKAQN